MRYEYDYMCGLLHDIGEARVYRILAAQPRPKKEGLELVHELLQKYHTTAGAEVARAWKLPPDIVDVCAAHHDAESEDTFHVRLTMLCRFVVETLAAEKGGRRVPPRYFFLRLGLDEEQLARVLTKTRDKAM